MAQTLRKDDTAILINFCIPGFPQDHAARSFTLLRASWQTTNAILDLGHGIDCVCMKAVFKMRPVQYDQTWQRGLRATRITIGQYSAKIGRDRHPTLAVHLLVKLASETQNHCPRLYVPSPEMPSQGPETKRRIELAASAQSVALVPLGGVSSCARHLGGCLLARAPDLFIR